MGDSVDDVGADDEPELEWKIGAGFRRTRFGRIVAHFGDEERVLLENLVRQMMEFVSPAPLDADADPLARLVGIDADAEVPEDPALLRLLPDAYPDDPEASAEFRRFTERGLRESKLANANVLLDSLHHSGTKITLSEPQAAGWLGALTDLRLTLGHRLGIVGDDDHDAWYGEQDVDDEINALRLVYDWLTWMQESLVHALMPS